MKQNVIVVGAGPTGLVTALGLARSGVDVTVLESEPAITDSPRAVVYHWAVLDGLQRLGILQDAIRLGFINPELRYVLFDTGERIRLSLGVLSDVTEYPYSVHLGQEKLAQIVLEHLLRLPDTRVHWNTQVTGIQQSSSEVTLRAETPDGVRDYRADWVVGADGGRSSVRQLLGLKMEGMTWPERFVATNIRYDYGAHDFCAANMVIGSPYGAIVARIDNSGLWRCTYCESDSLPEETIAERIPAYFQRTLPGSKQYELVRFSPYRMHQRAAERMRVGRVLLAGDAAHITNPTGGLGLTSGLFDAYVLYEALAAIVNGQADEEILDRYAEQRRRAFLDHASPAASEFKRLVYHPTDAAAVQKTAVMLRQLAADPKLAREVLMAAKRVETPSLISPRSSPG